MIIFFINLHFQITYFSIINYFINYYLTYYIGFDYYENIIQ